MNKNLLGTVAFASLMLSLVGDALGPKTDSHLWRDPVESDGLFGVFVPSPYEVPAGVASGVHDAVDFE